MTGKLKRLLLRIRGPLLPVGVAARGRGRGRLVYCAVCGSSVVNPVDLHIHDASRWWVMLRCGECAWSREAIITDAEAKQLERDLEPGLVAIAKAAAKLDRERMVREGEIFLAALQRDLIGPGDFTRDLRR
jgi:hypothetical protein